MIGKEVVWSKNDFVERQEAMQEVYQKYFDMDKNDDEVKNARVSLIY